MKLPIGGYNLFEDGPNQWTVEVIDGRSFSGTFIQVTVFAAMILGIKLEEVDTAIQSMIQEDHDVAHFGINGSFIFSYERRESHYRKVS